VATAVGGRPGKLWTLLGNGPFRRVLASDAISSTGDVVYWVALIVFLLERRAGGALVAAAVVARLLPRVLFGALGGVVADHVDRRRLVVALDAGRAVLMLLLAAVWAADGPAVVVLAVVFVGATLGTPYRPALAAGSPRLVGEADLAAANALANAVSQVTSLSGPLLGALLLAVTTPAWAFAANGVSFAVSAALLATVGGLGRAHDGLGPGAAALPSLVRQLTGGVRSIRRHRGLADLMALVAVMMMLRGAELVLHVQVASDLLDLGPSGYGLIAGALGLGALGAAPFAGRVAATRRPGRVLLGSVVASCASLALLAVVGDARVAMVVLAVEGASVLVFEVLALTTMQRTCPADVLGRVLGIQNTVSGTAKLVGSVVAPALVAGLGLRGAVAGAAGIIAALALLLTPRIASIGARSASRMVEIEPLVEVLGRIGALEGASRPAVERLAFHVQVEAVAAGSVVVREGEAADDFYVVRAGSFAVQTAGVVVNTMGRDDWFGEIGLLRRAPRTATVVATEDGVLWRIGGDAFLAAVTSAPALPEPLVAGMTMRLARTDAARAASAP
jgi:MFS family permease